MNRLLGRTRAFAGLLVALWRIPFWLAATPGGPSAKRLERSFFEAILRAFAVHLRIRGRPAPAALIVTNHISWIDIVALAARFDAGFVAKAEVAGWPIVGRLAERFGVIFVARHKPLDSEEQVSAIRAQLAAGRSIILFPEGTTSDGTGILRFRSSLFAAAGSASAVQPAMLRYTERDGSSLSRERQRAIAWVDDDDLLEGAARVARERTYLEIAFLTPLDPHGFENRKALAAVASEAIGNAYAAAPNRPR